MEIHLVDATYELFRAHYAPRPPVQGRDGHVLNGVVGLVEQLLALTRDEGATHVGCATDRVVESFRNDRYPRYKSSAGVPDVLLAQFPIAEAAIEALGFVVWPMVAFEADDAIASACRQLAADPAVERIVICSPDKDLAQLVVGDRVVLRDRRRRRTYDAPAVAEKWGVPPTAIVDWLALVGDTADGYPGIPGWGATSAAAVLARYGSLEAIPASPTDWDVPGLRGAARLAAALEAHRRELEAYRDLARLRTEVPITVGAIDLEWRGVPRERWLAFCEAWGLGRLTELPHRWQDGPPAPSPSSGRW